jgi:hypothetical protein
MRITRLAVVLAWALCVPLHALAATVEMTSSTQYLWYPDFLSDDEDQRDIAQYLRVRASFGEKENLRVTGYGRIVGQLGTTLENRPELADDLNGRLYYLFLDYRDVVPGRLDLRLGRTFVGTAAIPALVDGLQARGRDLAFKGLGASVFGGRRVTLENRAEIGDARDAIFGGSLFYETVRQTYAELSYARDYTLGDLARETTALDLSTTPHRMVNLFGRAAYDTVADQRSELMVGGRVTPLANLVLRGEYYDALPSFDRESFYSFFDVERFQQLSVGAEYGVIAGVRLSASYANERFGGGETADVFGVGATAMPVRNPMIRVGYDNRSGFAGDLDGFRASASYRYRKATLFAGADYADFRRAETREGETRVYWGALSYEVHKRVSGTVRVQRSENFLFDAGYQGFFSLDVNL